MANHGTTSLPILMYHAIRRSPAGQVPPGWNRRRAIDAAAFTAQLDAIVAHGMHPVSLGALDQVSLPARPVVITFDDGHCSDYLIAAPELKARRLTAAFFVTWSFLDRPGYLKRQQVRELRYASFEIGSHGLTHKRLTEVGPVELWREALDSKRRLEDLLGVEVSSFALPSGAYNDAVLQALWGAGYRRIMTSDFGYGWSENTILHRMGVIADTTQREFQAFLTAGPAWAARRRLIDAVKRRASRVLPRSQIGSTVGPEASSSR